MPITPDSTFIRLSGGAGNSDPAASLGGAMSSTAVDPATLWDQVSSAEAAAGSTEYRCIYVRNSDATRVWQALRFWLPANTPSADTDITCGLGTAAVSAAEQTVASETTAPAGVTFSAPSTKAAGLLIGDLAVAAYKAVWLKRTVNAGAAAVNDTFSYRAEGDSVA